ncbi:MAG TPA: prolyl oligopeptidase family serine peptidase [Acidobacteriota bacterium]|nr:prolyl oligopeptidase family serine peptidase [Acidobacteriota bacterium]
MRARTILLAIVAVLVAGTAGGLAADRPFTLADVLAPAFPSDLTAAKRADRLAWIMNDRGARNVWTAAAPDFKPLNLTGFGRDEVFEIDGVWLSEDGATALFTKGGRPNAAGWVTNSDSDPDGREQAVWAVRTEGGRPWRIAAGSDPVIAPDGLSALLVKDGLVYRVPLAPRSDTAPAPEPELLFRAAGRNGSPRFSPDGNRVAFVSVRDDHSFVGVFDLARRRITWIAPSVDRDSDPRWSADGTLIAFVRRPGLAFDAEAGGESRNRGPADLSIRVADAATGQARELWRTPKASPRFYTFRNFDLATNDRILFTAEREEWNHVFSMPLAGGTPEDITPGDGFVEHLGLSSDGASLFFSSNQGDLHGRRIWKVATAGGKAVAISPGDAIGTLPVALSSGKRAAFLSATAVRPTSVATVPTGGGKVETVAPRELPAEFPLRELVTPRLVTVKAADGLEIPCQLFIPQGAKAGDRRPAVVFTHGGPIRQMLLGWHYMEFYSEAYGINQFFAGRGYVVLSINYRSGIGYGRSFREAPQCGLEGAAEYQDILAGAGYLRTRPEVDPERIGAWGLSYGGLLTALSLARNSDIFKVGVDMAGVHDWSQMRWARLDETRRKVARESSPVAAVATWTSPVLFIHGDDDRNVPFQQTTDLVQKLRAKGDVPIELMIAPDEPHEFLLHAHRMAAYESTFEFIDRYIGRKK